MIALHLPPANRAVQSRFRVFDERGTVLAAGISLQDGALGFVREKRKGQQRSGAFRNLPKLQPVVALRAQQSFIVSWALGVG